MIRSLLGLNDDLEEPWPSQTSVADFSKVTRARIGQVVGKFQDRWSKEPAITRLRTDLFGIVESAGGAMAVSELAEALVVTRGCVEEEPLRTRLARSLVRAAVEVERSMGEPRFQVRRDGDRVLVALSQDLAGYAFRLGDLADKLAAEDPLVPPQRVLATSPGGLSPGWCSRAHGLSVGPACGGGLLSGRSLQPAGTLSHGDGCRPAPSSSLRVRSMVSRR